MKVIQACSELVMANFNALKIQDSDFSASRTPMPGHNSPHEVIADEYTNNLQPLHHSLLQDDFIYQIMACYPGLIDQQR